MLVNDDHCRPQVRPRHLPVVLAVSAHVSQTVVRDGQDFKRRGWKREYYGKENEGAKKAARQARTAEPTGADLGDDEDGHGSHTEPETSQLAAEQH